MTIRGLRTRIVHGTHCDKANSESIQWAPETMLHVQEAVVLQVIVHLGDQPVEYETVPELLRILRYGA